MPAAAERIFGADIAAAPDDEQAPILGAPHNDQKGRL
jgi:hypothetical protein